MRIAVVSDIHGNLTALEAVLADLKRTSPDLIFHGGDLGYGGARPAEVVDRIRELGWPGVCGNTDEMLGENRLRWLKTLPHVERQTTMALVHASPKNLWQAPSPETSDEELKEVYHCLDVPVAVYAHIHRPYVRKLPGMTVANTGSVSLSYDGDRRASYLILDETQSVEEPSVRVRRVEYDVDCEAEALLSSGMPPAEWISQTLRAARYVPLA